LLPDRQAAVPRRDRRPEADTPPDREAVPDRGAAARASPGGPPRPRPDAGEAAGGPVPDAAAVGRRPRVVPGPGPAEHPGPDVGRREPASRRDARCAVT